MRAGTLRRRVTFQRRAGAQDTFGQQVTDWIDVLANVPADIQALSGRELLAAQAINAELTHTIVVRYHSLLADPVKTASMRAVYVNAGVTRFFNVKSAENVGEQNVEIDLMVSEGLNQG
jgi:SPP1 family predicted phage head-tail adaptor